MEGHKLNLRTNKHKKVGVYYFKICKKGTGMIHLFISNNAPNLELYIKMARKGFEKLKKKCKNNV